MNTRSLRSLSTVRIGIGVAALASLPMIATPAGSPPAGDTARPTAPKVPHMLKLHGDTLQDDYFWLREKDEPGGPRLPGGRERLHRRGHEADGGRSRRRSTRRCSGRIKETDLSVPYREGGYFYYSRTEEGKQYPIYCRQEGQPGRARGGPARRQRAREGREVHGVGDVEVSDDGNLLAYTTDTTGFREYTLHVKDLRTGQVCPETRRARQLRRVGGGQQDALLRDRGRRQAPLPALPARARDRPAKDALVYEEKDELFRVGVHALAQQGATSSSLGSSHTAERVALPAGRRARPRSSG